MLLYTLLLTGLLLTACNAQANDKTIEEELDALLLDLDSGGRRIEMVEHVLGATVDTRLKLLDGDRLRLQNMGVRRGYLGCWESICDMRFCPSWNLNNLQVFDGGSCGGEIFQIIGEGLQTGDPITSGMQVRIRYTYTPNTWFACVNQNAANCDKRTCPGSVTQARDFDRCQGEAFHIYARGRAHGEDIANGDLIMLFSSYSRRRYVAANGQNDADDLIVDFCPGETPPAYLSFAYCSKNVWRVYKEPASTN